MVEYGVVLLADELGVEPGEMVHVDARDHNDVIDHVSEATNGL